MALLSGVVVAIVLPLLARGLGWSWFDSYWQSLFVSAGTGMALGGGGYLAVRFLQRETTATLRRQALRADAVKLAGPPRSVVPGGDVEAPRLVEFSIAPTEVSVGEGPAMVTLEARIVDDRSGVAGEGFTSSPTQVRFQSPTALQFQDGVFEAHVALVEGDSFDGRFRTEVVIPRFAESGLWEVAYFLLVDQVGNTQYLTPEEMQAAGLPTSLVVRD